jgi:hypothetical protein
MVSGIHDFDALLTVYGVCDPFDFICYEAVKCLYEFVDFFLHGRKCRFVVPGQFPEPWYTVRGRGFRYVPRPQGHGRLDYETCKCSNLYRMAVR